MTGREYIPGGWIDTGPCGRPHLAGPSWAWWRCPTCADLTHIPPPRFEETAA